MLAHRNVLPLLAAALSVAVSTDASAQRLSNHPSGNYESVRPLPPRGGGGFGVMVPGIILAPHMIQPPPGGAVFVDDGTVDARPRATPRRQGQSNNRRTSNAPPANERRLVPDEVVIELSNTASVQQIDALQRRHRLTRLESQRLQLSGTTLFRWRIPDRRSVASVVRALESDPLVASAQPNYLFTLQQAEGKAASEGDAAQYALAKLRLPQAHALAKGDDVLVAVIDSAIDRQNPELAGSIAGSFDVLDKKAAPHKHGTAIAGLIAAHGKLMGAAPDAKILAVTAFDPDDNGAQGTTFGILKGLDWAVANHARIVNMSFAGPPDPALHRALGAAHKRGVVLIAAAGNAGAKSPPLYPAADANVIAVTATDADDKLFEASNRGSHIALAAPGAQIMVAIPDGYEMSSGTSYAAAEVSGIAALMLQRDGKLTPDRLRHILQSTAHDLGPKGRDPLFGFGLADAFAAVMAEPAPVASSTPAVERVSVGGR
jgi:subtilisin family serine protease